MIDDKEILVEIQKLFPLQVNESISRESILQQLEIRLSQLLQQNSETFFQLMYRLDISEKKLAAVLENKQNTIAELAMLIYDRQAEKITSRQNHPFRNTAQDEDLTW